MLLSSMERITSLQNPNVKQWSSLTTKKGRDRADSFLVEGAHLVKEAVKSGFEVTTILYVPDSPAAEEVKLEAGQDNRWTAVSEQVMGKITDTQAPQGIAAVVKKRSYMLDERLASGWNRAVVAVDAVQDPGNLGTIIRSADASGASAVLLGKGTVDLYNPKTLRATMGSLFHLPIVFCDLHKALPILRAAGISIVATSLEAKQSCYEASLEGKVCFLLGNEGAGVSPALLGMADRTVIIPMQGAAESLNVAMAGTVLLFEAMRQRSFQTVKIPDLE